MSILINEACFCRYLFPLFPSTSGYWSSSNKIRGLPNCIFIHSPLASYTHYYQIVRSGFIDCLRKRMCTVYTLSILVIVLRICQPFYYSNRFCFIKSNFSSRNAGQKRYLDSWFTTHPTDSVNLSFISSHLHFLHTPARELEGIHFVRLSGEDNQYSENREGE